MRAPQVVLVAYRSPLWLKVAVGSFLAHFPDQRILVVDNNPRPGEHGWQPQCEEERKWLAAHPGVRLLDGGRELGIDVRTDEWSWNTGLKPWFYAAIVDRAVQVPKSGFAHYWRGSINRQEHLHLFLDPRLLRYSRPSVRQWTHVVSAALVPRLGRRPGAA